MGAYAVLSSQVTHKFRLGHNYCIYTHCILPTQCTLHHILMADSDKMIGPAISLLNQVSSRRSCVVHFLSYLKLKLYSSNMHV